MSEKTDLQFLVVFVIYLLLLGAFPAVMSWVTFAGILLYFGGIAWGTLR